MSQAVSYTAFCEHGVVQVLQEVESGSAWEWTCGAELQQQPEAGAACEVGQPQLLMSLGQMKRYQVEAACRKSSRGSWVFRRAF